MAQRVDEWSAAPGVNCEDSILIRGFRTAGLADALPEFAMAMDAFLGSRRCGLQIQPPPCPHVTHDEAVVVALCGLAQGNFDRPLAASLARLLPPSLSPAAFHRLKSFTAMLDAAGLSLGPRPGEGGGRLQ